MIEVIKPGILTSIQDDGRYGFQDIGVSVCGAMDKSAARIANLLLGNRSDAAVLEMMVMGAELRFTQDTYIALTGARWPAILDDEPVPQFRPTFVKAGQILRFTSNQSISELPLNIAYLAVLGGIQSPIVMGSRSCDSKNHLGQPPLKAGDTIDIPRIQTPSNRLHKEVEKFKIYLETNLGNHKKSKLRVMAGLHWDLLTPDSKEAFLNTEYRITPASNRMGFRLEGKKLELTETINMLSESTVFGTIQLPPAGQPIVLMADRQTTGGYPKIANIIWADLGYLAQMPANVAVQFQLCTLAEAQTIYLDRQQKWEKLKESLIPMKELQELL